MDSALPRSGLDASFPLAGNGTGTTPAPATAVETSAPAKPKAFGSPSDFFLLGGASLIIMVFLSVLELSKLDKNPEIAGLLGNFAAFFAVLAVFVNYPHAFWSYRLAYQQGRGFIKQNFLSLVAFPVIIWSLLGLCVVTWTLPMKSVPLILGADDLLQNVGIFTSWSLYGGVGQMLLATLLIYQMVASTQHYCLQSYGVALACAHGQSYKLTVKQKDFIRYNLYALWAMNVFSGYTFFTIFNNQSFSYYPPRFPEFVNVTCYAACIITAVLMWTKVIWPVYKETKTWPPLTAAVAFLSIWVWLQPFYQPYGYMAWIVPAAHCIQYLSFVYRVEANDFANKANPVPGKKPRGGAVYFSIVIAAVLIAGYLGFDLVPASLDGMVGTTGLPTSFFILASFIYINTHHYIIDGVVWRSRSSKARSLLLASG